MQFTWPGETVIVKLIETLSKGAGTLTKPWQIRRDAIANADAQRIMRLAEEKARQEIDLVRSGELTISNNYKLICAAERSSDKDAELIEAVAEDYVAAIRAGRTSPSDLIQLEHQINLEQISRIALEEASEMNSSEADDEPINRDWFSQWRNRAREISDEEMQRLWAKALAGEARRKGSFSIHTLDFLSRMSRHDAELIGKLGQFALGGDFIFKVRSKIPAAVLATGVTFGDLLKLEALGVLIGASTGIGGVSKNFPAHEFNGRNVFAVGFGDKLLFITPNDQSKASISFECFSITFLGLELLKLANSTPNIQYLKEFADTHRNEATITIVTIISRDAGNEKLRLSQEQPF
ncbi:MAG: hypothetical protein CVT79_17425 [Alphaproteobacteria bacterium HGW-Alphaproteobacteria-18]|nr:MAG: hypothetical protein CVT79_17425 [Alphaproteobacteria bacterium HGW-Alphaproteobacteria-18]